MWNARTLRCAVVILVGGVVLFTANADKRPVPIQNQLSLVGLLPNFYNGSWFSDTELLYLMDYSLEMVKYNVETETVTTVVNRTLMVNRHSYLATYTLVEVETGVTCELAGGQVLQLLVWAPVGHAIAFVQDNDVFYQSVHCPTPNTQKITDSPDYVFNGIADWIYEEEVLEDTKALWFSPDGKKMVFSTMDDTNVRNMSLWQYNNPGSLDSQYVEQVVIRYPKAGTTNLTVTLNYVDLEQTPIKYQSVVTPVDLVSDDNILGPVTWADNTHFSPTWMTRVQNKAYTLICNSQDLKCTQMLEYVELRGWLTIKQPVFKNQTAFFTVLPRDQGGHNGNYRQLCLVSVDHTVALTSGLDVVIHVVKYDTKTGTVYYLGTVDKDPAQVHLFAVTDDGQGSAKRLSCQSGCRHNTADFSEDASYYILTCNGKANPYGTDLYSKDGRFIKRLVDNKVFLEELNKNLDLPLVKNLDVPVANGFTAKVRLYVPSSLKEDGSVKYPVLFGVYSGPDSIKITEVFKFPGFEDYLTSSRGIILVNMDGRGTARQGDNIKFEMYHKLGGPEIEDILDVTRYLQTNLPYVDAKRTAIWGWSYGGYATAMTLAKGTDQLFKCGLSVAPVTSWLYYDSVYTERYMGLPTNDSNLEGYRAGDITSRVENFRHKLFYLIHGNFDDNVHYQQSMALSKALEFADILFYHQSYPDENHSLFSVRKHLYHSMDKFWTKCFQLKQPAYNDTRSFTNFRYEYIDKRPFKSTWGLQGKIKNSVRFHLI